MKEQASHTLFRFVSFRSPELIAPQKPSRKFIYELIDDGGQKRVREMSDGTFEERSTGLSILTQNEIRNKNQELHDFGAWIQKNRRNFELQEVEDKLQLLSGNSAISDEESVWLNLYHQYKTQENHSARESLINLIIAKNVVDESKKVSREISEEELLEILTEIANARIVIPNDVIDVAEAAAPTSGPSVFKRASAETEARISSVIATYKLEQLKLAKEELEFVEKEYRKEYDAAYKAALDIHNASVKTLTDQYKDDLQVEQELWFNSRKESSKSVRDEEFLFNKIAKTKLPDLPKFEFVFRPEIETGTASRDMSSLLYDTLKSLTAIERIDTFEEAYSLLSEEETRLSEIQISNKKLSSKKISFNGTIISGNDRNVLSIDVCYAITLRSETTPVNNEGNWYWEYYIDLQGIDREVNIQDLAYKLTFTNGNEIAGTTYITTYTDTVGNTYERTLRIFPQVGGIELDASLGIPAISGTVTLQNGDILTFDSVLNPNSFITRIITCDEINGDTGGNTDTNTDENFIPSGFGMRQLGIADYRRVEQNVHCYVEGEVSHIENVMAREYKEKSTRRLRRSENTTSTTSETEKEQLTDTSTTDRFEMQNEVAQVIAESTSIDAFANVSGGNDLIQFSTGAGFANNTSQEDSISQAVTEAQEITSRAMDRVVQKVKEERITKIIEEYEENNRHGFDNREGDKHVVGVYRWIDKVYKNQIYNYGKRLMYEFFIPEPSRLHKLALTETIEGNEGTLLEKPIDPRTEGLGGGAYIFRSSYRSWAARYNAIVDAPPDDVIHISAAISDNGASGNYLTDYHHPGGQNWTVEIPENYEATHYAGKFGFTYIHNANENTNGTVNIERKSFSIVENTTHGNINVQSDSELINKPIRNELGISFHGGDVGGMSLSLRIKCELTTEAFDAWRLATFNAIMEGYKEQLAKYEEQFVAETETATVLRESNPLFYRQIEQTVLRKNCISYLIDRDQDGERTYGKSGLYEGTLLEDAEVKLNQRLDNYTSFATFLEQAIEWDIMSYNFYPFYWANRGKWGELYQYENNDPTFRKFMQAGMARVVVTVRPGFEDAMMHYMATGNVWDGGELPVLDDPLYLSIVEELQQPLGIKEGEAWKTQVPTSLTILQADSIGLKVDKPLPCNCENEKDFQESDQTGCLSGISNEADVFSGKDCNLGIPGGIPLVQFSLRHFYGKKTIGDVDTDGAFPRTFRCQGQTIEIQRDASWLATDSVAVLYQSLAAQLSSIPGITASQFDYISPQGVANGSAVLFTVDFNVVDTFEFEKASYGFTIGLDKITVNTDGETVQFIYGDDELGTYIQDENRLADADGTVLSYEEIQNPLPIDRFLSQTTLTE